MKYSNPLRPLRWAMLSIEPVERLSRISTSWPWSSNVSDRWEPMKPAPPVISARTRDVLSGNLQARREVARRFGNGPHVGVAHRRIERQRPDLVAGPRGNRALGRPRRCQRRLRRDRHGIVNQRLDAVRGEVRLEGAARFAPDDEQMVDVTGVDLRHRIDGGIAQRAAVLRRERTPPRDPLWQPGEPRTQDGRLQFVEA